MTHNQNKSVLLDSLIATIICEKKNTYNSTYKMSAGKFKKLIEKINETNLALSIDPNENSSYQNVMLMDNYTVFNGTDNTPAYNLESLKRADLNNLLKKYNIKINSTIFQYSDMCYNSTNIKLLYNRNTEPSANIFTTKNGVQKYRCCSENLTLNIKQLIEMLGDFKSEFKAIQFIMDIYNLSIKESQWSIEQRENIDMMINNITLNKFQELCPQADKNIKYAKDTFLMMLSIARNNIYSEKFSNDDGEIVFYVTNKKLAEYMGKGNSQKKIDKINKYVKMLIYHDLIRILDNDQIPKELLKNALKYTNGNKNRVNFYAIPSWVVQQLKTIEDNGIRWKDKGYRIGGVSFDMFYRSEGFEVAASLYPQYKKKKNEYGEIVNRTTTKASDERTLKISEVILHCIQRKGYCTEKEVVYILGNEYRYEVTETQIKRCLNEIMDCYGLKKVKTNKVLKEQFDIKSDGYPYIIIEDEI